MNNRNNFNKIFKETDKKFIKGIDVSVHNGKIDWAKVKEDGVDFAIVRLGYAEDNKKYDDKNFISNILGCIKNDIPCGVYLYSYAESVKDAEGEANHIIRRLDEAFAASIEAGYTSGWVPEFPIYYDLEDAETTGKCSKADILKFAKTVCEKLNHSGYNMGIYANLNWFTNKLTSDWYRGFLSDGESGPCPTSLWIAHYVSKTPVTDSEKSKYRENYDIWQHTSSGSVKGISGNVDMNILYYDESIYEKEDIDEITNEEVIEEVTNNDNNDNDNSENSTDNNTLNDNLNDNLDDNATSDIVNDSNDKSDDKQEDDEREECLESTESNTDNNGCDNNIDINDATEDSEIANETTEEKTKTTIIKAVVVLIVSAIRKINSLFKK